MDRTQAKATPSVAIRILKLPFQGLWFLIKHPVVAIVMVLLIAVSSISLLAHFNSEIAARFNSAAGFFGTAILSSEAADIIRNQKKRIAHLEEDIKLKKATIKQKSDALKNAADALEESSASLRSRKATISAKNKALNNAAQALNDSSVALKTGSNELKMKTNLLKSHQERLARFRTRGEALSVNTKNRFTKVAIYDAAGEFTGWIPIIGDAASIGLAAGGIYQMCQMFKEIEEATDELGVRYQVYSDTFCEKPVQKTKEIIAEKAGEIKGSYFAMTTVVRDYATKIPAPSTNAMRDEAQYIIDRIYNIVGI